MPTHMNFKIYFMYFVKQIFAADMIPFRIFIYPPKSRSMSNKDIGVLRNKRPVPAYFITSFSVKSPIVKPGSYW